MLHQWAHLPSDDNSFFGLLVLEWEDESPVEVSLSSKRPDRLGIKYNISKESLSLWRTQFVEPTLHEMGGS